MEPSPAGDVIPATDVTGLLERQMTTILIVILILILVGALPSWGYSRSWGYGPSGLVTVLLVILIVMMLTGRL
ncbi:DUF3309 domain-containing protein [Ancylobacter dichloromethanicus]|uniref:DUF3309 domain-containing protein n=2 Tax=Ancylobacter dichloromethanicus TaxID=518825 RepID=A0A9W6J5Y4_9HYPH|nr:hypothetical protein GCM10017643_05310 [Ancylobacter dichloromethanicus]